MPQLNANVLKLKAAINGERAIYTIEGHPGLYLHVHEKGRASWVIRYRIGGVMKERVLSNDAARADFEEVKTAKDEIRLAVKTRGVDLFAERQAAAEAAALSERADKRLLTSVVDEWINKPRKKGLRPKTVKLYRATFEAYILPTFGKRPIGDITKPEIRDHFTKLKEKLLKKGGRVTRAEVVGKAHTYLEAVFEFAVDEGYILASPMRGLPRPVPKEPDRKRSRPLRASEVQLVWEGADKHLSPTFARVMKLLLLLGRRRAEVSGALKEEFFLEAEEPYWVIPPREGNKSGMPAFVPISRASLKIIKEAWESSGTSRYLFPRSRGLRDAPVHSDAITHAWRELCEAVGVTDKVNLHDARGLMTDALEVMGVPDNIVSHCLHHTSDMKGTTAKRVYSSNQFHKEKRRALRLWELRLRSMVRGEKPRTLKW